MSVFRFGAAHSPPRRPTVQGSGRSPFCTSPSQLQEVTLDPNMNTTIPFSGRSPGKTSPLRGHAMKEYEEQLSHLKKENFNLKLRIYFLEERTSHLNGADDKEDIMKKNIELKVEAESLHKDVSDKQALLCQASKALEILEEQHSNQLKQLHNDREMEKGVLESRIQEMEKELKVYEEKCAAEDSVKHRTQEEVERLQQQIKELETQVNQLASSVQDESERANQLNADLQYARQKTERVTVQCHRLEVDLKQRNNRVEDLKQELEQKDLDLVNNKLHIQTLEDVLSAKEPEIQIKVQELCERDRIIEEKECQIEQQNKVLVEIQITLEEKKRQVDDLRSFLAARDESIAAFESKLEKAKAAARNMEAKLDASLRDAHLLGKEVETLRAQLKQEKEKSSSNMLQKARHELNEKNKEVQVLKTTSKIVTAKLKEMEEKWKQKDEKIIDLEARLKKSCQTIQTFSKMCKERNRELEQLKLDTKKKDSQIQDLTSERNELRDSCNKAKWEARQLQAQDRVQGAGGVLAAFDEVKDMAEEENERLWAEVEDKNKKLVQLTEERDGLSLEMEKQVQSLLKRLTEKEERLEEFEKQLAASVDGLQSRDNRIVELEHELDELRALFKELKGSKERVNYKEEGQQTECDAKSDVSNLSDSTISKAESELTLELVDKKREIERLNAELRKRTTNLQELVNKELWDKNREIEKLQDRLNIMCERKEMEIIALRQQIEARDFQLKVVQDRVDQLGAQVNFPSAVVIKELQPLTFNQHVHIQPPDTDEPREGTNSSVTVPALKDEVLSLREQLLSSGEEKKYLCQKLEELREQLRNIPQHNDNRTVSTLRAQCEKVKGEAEHAEALRKEAGEVCAMLTRRLEELARFLSSLLKRHEYLGELGSRHRKILKQVVENSMELSRTLTMSFIGVQEPNNSILQMSSISGLLTSASEMNLNLLELWGEEDDNEMEGETSCCDLEQQDSAKSTDTSLTPDSHCCRISGSTDERVTPSKSKEFKVAEDILTNKDIIMSEQAQVIQRLRSQVEVLKQEIEQRDIGSECRENNGTANVVNVEKSDISCKPKVMGDHNEGKGETESSFNSMTFYNSHHCSNSNSHGDDKWLKAPQLPVEKEDAKSYSKEEKEVILTCKQISGIGEVHHKSASSSKLSPFRTEGARLSQSANATPVKADSAIRSSCNQRIRRSSSANAVAVNMSHPASQHREYGVASLSESEAWSEPDRNVSMARIGLQEDNLKGHIPLVAGSVSTTCCTVASSGRGRGVRIKEVDNSSESSEETAREVTRTPGKRLRGDAGDTRRLQNKIRGLEQLNEALRAELNILHQLTPTTDVPKPDDMQPHTRDISVNTSRTKLDKSTSVEQLHDDGSSVTIPANLLEQIRYQREKLESSLFHNDFIRRQLEAIFTTLTSSQGEDIVDIWQKLKESTEELCAARTQVQELQAKVLELETQLERSKGWARQLEDTVEQLQVTRKSVSLLKEQIATLETKLKEKDNEILEQNCLLLQSRNESEEQRIQAEKAIEDAYRLKEEYESQVRETDLLLADSERRVREAEQQLKEWERKLQETEKQKESLRNETSEKINEIGLEIYEAERRRNEAEIQVIEAKKQLQEEESKRYETEWKVQTLEEKVKLREGEFEKHYQEMLERRVKELELRANLQIREAEKKLEQREWIHKSEAEKKVQEAERLGCEFEAGLRRQIEEAERHGKTIRAEGDKRIKELEEKYKAREAELKKRVHESERRFWEKDSELRRQLDEASMKHSQAALERTRLVNEKMHLEQEVRRHEAREAELARERKEAENLLVLGKDRLETQVLELEQKRSDLERRVRELEYVNSELEQRLAKMHMTDSYHSQHSSGHLSGPHSSSFPYRKTDAGSSSSGLDTYSGDGSLPSSPWSLPTGTLEDRGRKEDMHRGDGNSVGLSALSNLVLQHGFNRQRSELSDYMSEEQPVEEYEALFTQTCRSSYWVTVTGQHSMTPGSTPADPIVSRNINSSPDLGIESDQGRFSSLETSTLPPPLVHLEKTEYVKNQAEEGSDVDVTVAALVLTSSGGLENDYTKLQKENANLKRDLIRTRRSLQATLSQLTSSNHLKKQLERAICRQLHKTHHILKQARDNLEGDQVDYLTASTEGPE